MPNSIKAKYHAKVASDDAIFITWTRTFETRPLFAEMVWYLVPVFDLSELGMGLLYSILPVDYEPLNVGYTYERPTREEMDQGIWARFEPIRFEKLYRWMTDFRTYVVENFKEEFQTDLLLRGVQKAIYGVTPWGRGVYDPQVVREFLRATFMKLRLLRTPDVSYLSTLKSIVSHLEMTETTRDHVFNRLTMITSAQMFAFVLGLGVLGKSRLTEVENGMGKIPMIDAKGNAGEVKFRTLEHLQIGLILGVVPLGYGLLMPRTPVYKMPEGKKDPPLARFVREKAKTILRNASYFTFAHANYNKPEEMADWLKSEKADQYDMLMKYRELIERWVEGQVPSDEANPLRLRQYKSAVLQAVSWRAKRHAWGFGGWKAMTEDQFMKWWLDHWSAQGLNVDVLRKLYEGMSVWLPRIREEKLRLGELVKEKRKRLALAP